MHFRTRSSLHLFEFLCVVCLQDKKVKKGTKTTKVCIQWLDLTVPYKKRFLVCNQYELSVVIKNRYSPFGYNVLVTEDHLYRNAVYVYFIAKVCGRF